MNNKAFSNYVQSISFTMVLSRNLIDLLGMVRDHSPRPARQGRDRFTDGVISAAYSFPLMIALERRGLVSRADNEMSGVSLTRAGELTCDLLVEAGLLKAKSAKRAA